MAAENAKPPGSTASSCTAPNGYLVDQFLRDGSNKRSDEYGRQHQNRARFPLEVTEAVTRVWDPLRVGVQALRLTFAGLTRCRIPARSKRFLISPKGN